MDQAKIYLGRSNRALHKLHLEEGVRISKKMDAYESLIIPKKNKIKLTNYNPYEAIKAPLSVG